MIIQKLFVAFFVIIFSFNTSYCKNNNDFNEIEGLWISAEETTSLFGPWAEKVALLIGRDTNKSLYARGFFMKDGESIAEWIFVNIRYESMNSISLIDEDSDTLICNFDEKNKILYGKIHSHDEQKSLNFVHAGKFLENRLLYARTPDENGKIKYSYCKPDQNDDSLKTESIYYFSCDSASISKLMKEIINQKYGKIKSLLILKYGKLVTEEYFYG